MLGLLHGQAVAPCFHYCHLLRVARQSWKRRTGSCYCEGAAWWLGQSSSWLQRELSLRHFLVRVWSLTPPFIFLGCIHPFSLECCWTPVPNCIVPFWPCVTCFLSYHVMFLVVLRDYSPDRSPLQWRRMEMRVLKCVYRGVCVYICMYICLVFHVCFHL